MDSTEVIGNFYGETVLHPLGLLAIIVLGLAMLLVPRRHAVIPMLIMGCFVAPAQRIAIFSLNFDLLRVMVLFGTARILMRREWFGFRWNALDTALVAWVVSAAAIYILHDADVEAVKYELGAMYDAVGMYFLFRCLVREWADVEQIARAAAIIALPVMLAFMVEYATARNVFAFLGGVPAVTAIRDGRLRCQGAFAHPILAGCFWASLMPLMAARWWSGGFGRWWATLGIGASILIVVMCASSTPVMAVGSCIIGGVMFLFRRWLRWVRYLTVGVLVVLHLIMKAPVWQLVARVDLVGGSTGWHRYNLINQAILHYGDWWLLGTRSVSEWGVFAGDVTNQYVLEAVRGGALTLALFILLIAVAFMRIGKLWRVNQRDTVKLTMAWALGVSLFAHCMSFVAVSYFGQINMLWYLALALIGSMPAGARVSVLQRRTRTIERATEMTGRRTDERGGIYLAG